MSNEDVMSLRGLCVVFFFLSACSSDASTTGGAGSGGAGAIAGQGPGGAGGVAGTPGAGGGTPLPGGSTGAGGSGNTGGAPRRPPNPRTDIGPPDGVECVGNIAGVLTCAVGQQCCPANVGDTATECNAPGALCTNCTFDDCGAALCDGPEDCPGQLCCFSERSCTGAGAPCTGNYGIAKCQDRCEDARLHEVVICHDARDCLNTDDRCIERISLPDLFYCNH